MNKVFVIRMDDHKYTLTLESINKFPNSHLYEILVKKIKDPHVFIQTDQIYIDKDPIAFSYIVDILRGYECDINAITDPKLKHKIMIDLSYFGPFEQSENFKDLDTTILQSNDQEKIQDFLKRLDEHLKTDPLAVIGLMSTDENICQFLSASDNQNHSESEVESLENSSE